MEDCCDLCCETRTLADGCCESSVSPSLLSSSSSLTVNVLLLLPLPPADPFTDLTIMDMPGVTSFERGFDDPATLSNRLTSQVSLIWVYRFD